MANEMLALNARAQGFQAFWAELESGNVPASNFHLEDLWVSAYAAINSANALIGAVPGLTELSQGDQDRIMGTAYYFRALMHLDLLRQFGEFGDLNSTYGVPIILEPSLEIKETTRGTVLETYNQIDADLDLAISLLDDHSDKFFVSLGAAQGLAARSALYRGEYSTAASLATAVIDNGAYTLSDNYNEVFITEGAAESIFELNFIQLADPNIWSADMYVTPPEVAVNDDLLSFFTTNGESERGLLFEEIDGYNRCTKYGRMREDEGANTIVQRLSEMFLIRAEALGMSGNPDDARADINAVRNRAGLLDMSAIGSSDELVDALLRERRAEFAFEGQYWFDMVRLGRMEQITGRESYRKTMPIPQREMNITNDVMVQNPGY